MPQSQSIVIWFIRDFSKVGSAQDAKLTLTRNRAGYTAVYRDSLVDAHDSLAFSTIEALEKYMELVFSNLLKDGDTSNNFKCVQYIIPGFPSVVQEVSRFDENESYNLLMDSILFYLDHSL